MSYSVKQSVNRLLGMAIDAGVKRTVIVAQGVSKKDQNYSTSDDDLIDFSL